MFAKLTTKIALKKAGIPSKALDISSYMPASQSASRDPKNPNSSDPAAQGAALPFANPFANLEVPKSWKSWATPPPPAVDLASPPVVGTRAPTGEKLRLPVGDGRGTVVVFLRHCGCPFAEKTFIETRRLANKYPSINFIAISHSSKAATDRWLSQLGGKWAVNILVDEEREIYAQWGLGISTSWYLLNPWTQMARQKLGKEEGNWGREVDPSGNRWQIGGAWATDEKGMVRWGGVSKTADEIADLVEGCKSIGAY